MTVTSVATAQTKKLMKIGLSLFRRSFHSSRCKTAAKMAVARIKLLRNKRQAVVRQMRRDIALLLQSGQDGTARIRVEHVIREQNVLAANEIIELFCELIVSRLSIIAKQRECPQDLKEGIASLIFAAPRCSEIPELGAIRDIFEKKYGRDFVSAATDVRPNCGVNRLLIDKLSVRPPTGEVKLKFMKEIVKEYQVEWDTTESEMELLKPPEEPIEGPRTFVSASSLPVKPAPVQPIEPNKPSPRTTGSGGNGAMCFEDTKSAAEAAAESAKQAIAAAQAAAYLANKDSSLPSQLSSNDNRSVSSVNSSAFLFPHGPDVNPPNINRHSLGPGTIYKPGSFNGFRHPSNEATPNNDVGGVKVYRRHSYNAPYAHSGIKFDESDIKFDESDCDEEIEQEQPPTGGIYQPPERPPPELPSSYVKQDSVSRVHPKLPDYDSLAARFEALRRSQT